MCPQATRRGGGSFWRIVSPNWGSRPVARRSITGGRSGAGNPITRTLLATRAVFMAARLCGAAGIWELAKRTTQGCKRERRAGFGSDHVPGVLRFLP